MISVKSLELVALGINTGRRLYISPYRFDSAKRTVAEIQIKEWYVLAPWRLVTSFSIGFTNLFAISQVFAYTSTTVPKREVVTISCCQAFFSVALVIQHFLLTRTHQLELLLNRYILLDQTFANRFAVERAKHDGMEKIIRLVITIVLLVPVVEFFGIYVMFRSKNVYISLLVSVTGFGNRGIYAVSGILTFFTSVMVPHVLMLATVGIMSQNAAIKWLKHRNADAQVIGNTINIRDLEIFYRSLQILHGEINAVAEYVIPGAQIVGIILIIGIPFALIKFGRVMNPFSACLLGIIGISAVIFLYMAMLLFARIREHSLKFPAAHRHVLDTRFRRSCQPIRWKMGGLYYVGRNSFPTLLKNLGKGARPKDIDLSDLFEADIVFKCVIVCIPLAGRFLPVACGFAHIIICINK